MRLQNLLDPEWVKDDDPRSIWWCCKIARESTRDLYADFFDGLFLPFFVSGFIRPTMRLLPGLPKMHKVQVSCCEIDFFSSVPDCYLWGRFHRRCRIRLSHEKIHNMIYPMIFGTSKTGIFVDHAVFRNLPLLLEKSKVKKIIISSKISYFLRYDVSFHLKKTVLRNLLWIADRDLFKVTS